MSATNHLVDNSIDSLTHSVGNFLRSGAHMAMSRANDAGRLIKRHPFAAVAIAVGVGYIAMRIVRR